MGKAWKENAEAVRRMETEASPECKERRSQCYSQCEGMDDKSNQECRSHCYQGFMSCYSAMSGNNSRGGASDKSSKENICNEKSRSVCLDAQTRVMRAAEYFHRRPWKDATATATMYTIAA